MNEPETPVTPEQGMRWASKPWNGEKPTECGFCPSKATAQRAVWATLERRIPVKSQRRAYKREWAGQFLSHQRDTDDRPEFSRCKISKGKWLWVVFRRGGWYAEEEPLARGVADTSEAAYEAAVETVGPVRQTGNWAADTVREKEAAVKRSQRATNKTDAASLEFVYECHWYESDYDGTIHDSITKHRIVKRTRKHIYVDREAWGENAKLAGDWRDFQQRTFILDRQEFEQAGKARRSGHWCDTYYADPAIYHAERKATAVRPECLAVLDLPADAPEDAIHAAYRRRAFKTHPDQGGDAEEFKRVRTAYEEALVFVGCA